MKFLTPTLAILILCSEVLVAKPSQDPSVKSSNPASTSVESQKTHDSEHDLKKEPVSNNVVKNTSTENTSSKKKEEIEKNSGDVKNKDKKKKETTADDSPWFVGTLLAIFGENIDPGRFLVEPIIYVSRVYGVYGGNSSLIGDRNAHLYTLLVALETGITKNFDVALYLTEVYTHTRSGSSSNLADTALQLGFQLSRDKKGAWTPNIRVITGLSFPTGKYQNLNPTLKLEDGIGVGAYRPFIGLIVQKIFYNIPNHPYSWNFNFTIFHHTKVPVHGLSIYGGEPNTRGFVLPGERFIANLAYEFKFNKNWGCGMDIHYDFQNSSSFHNRRGGNIFNGTPSEGQFSLAPEIEYNFSSQAALSFGLWYTLFGRNNFAFLSGVFLFSYEF